VSSTDIEKRVGGKTGKSKGNKGTVLLLTTTKGQGRDLVPTKLIGNSKGRKRKERDGLVNNEGGGSQMRKIGRVVEKSQYGKKILSHDARTNRGALWADKKKKEKWGRGGWSAGREGRGETINRNDSDIKSLKTSYLLGRRRSRGGPGTSLFTG